MCPGDVQDFPNYAQNMLKILSNLEKTQVHLSGIWPNRPDLPSIQRILAESRQLHLEPRTSIRASRSKQNKYTQAYELYKQNKYISQQNEKGPNKKGD